MWKKKKHRKDTKGAIFFLLVFWVDRGQHKEPPCDFLESWDSALSFSTKKSKCWWMPKQVWVEIGKKKTCMGQQWTSKQGPRTPKIQSSQGGGLWSPLPTPETRKNMLLPCCFFGDVTFLYVSPWRNLSYWTRKICCRQSVRIPLLSITSILSTPLDCGSPTLSFITGWRDMTPPSLQIPPGMIFFQRAKMLSLGTLLIRTW